MNFVRPHRRWRCVVCQPSMKKKLMKNIVYKLSSSYNMYERLGYVMLDLLIKVADN